MPHSSSRAPAQILESISAKSVTVREAATALAERIHQFQNYLSKLPGRVETYCYGDHPNASGVEASQGMLLCLKLDREGKDWVLSYGTYQEGYHDLDNPVSFKPLLEAPLKIRLAAVKMFPDMLEAIEKSQDDLVRSINAVTEEYDKFSAKLKIDAKEGR